VTRFVLDCSVSAAWCLRDDTSARADRVLRRLRDDEAVVPPLWAVEMANVLLAAQRRRRIAPADAERAMELVLGLPIVVEPEDRSVMARLHRLGIEHGIAAYDAAYIDLALRLALPLATLDRDMAKAARKSGLAVLP
jgi:predicted nucleic acid-binding protein